MDGVSRHRVEGTVGVRRRGWIVRNAGGVTRERSEGVKIMVDVASGARGRGAGRWVAVWVLRLCSCCWL